MQSKRLPPPSSIAETIKSHNEDLDDELQIEKYYQLPNNVFLLFLANDMISCISS